MRRIRLTYVITILTLTILWLIADDVLLTEYEFSAWRSAFINYTGIVGMGAMSVAMMLAARPVSIEPFLGGLDKSYRLHKWLGISGLIFSVLHFLLANVPKIMIGAGWLDEPAREPVTEQSVAVLQFFQSQHWIAEECGDWGFKAALVLLLIALIKWFPYRFFFGTHRLLSVVYLFLAFHSLALMKFSYWDHAIAPVTAILLAGGTVVAIVSLLGKVGSKRRAVGEIERVQYLENNSVLKVGIRLKGPWAGHEEGQFAFVTFDRREGAHPFTIATPWKGDGIVAFFIKGLGDYTKTLPATLKKGDLVTVEGPYGRFGFNTAKKRQIWVAGGIGIAPFVARIKALMNEPDARAIDLFYSAGRADDEQFMNRLRAASSAANVRLHISVPAKDGRLNAERICQMVPEWREAGFWFCGPARFGDSLRDDLVSRGLSADDFHQELFEMR
jgi:predicted ferric reductase